MPRTVQFQANFSAGELSPLMRGRTDYPGYAHGALTIENFQVLLQGGLEKVHGTRQVAPVKHPAQPTRLAPFIFRNVDALVLEIGHEYIRFFKNGARIESPPGVPVEVPTAYQSADVFALRLVQKNDVVYITHQDYIPRKLQRLSDTSWSLVSALPDPPPTAEAGRQPAVALTLGATTGTGITATASSAVWLASDVDREVSAGGGLGIITSVTSPTVAVVTIVAEFASVNIASGAWTLTGSPVAQLKPSKAGPVGAIVTLALGKEQPSAPNLVTNGDFATNDLTGWTNYSGGVSVSGTHDGAANSASLVDSTKDFLALGVRTTQLLENTTDASSGQVSSVATTRLGVALAGGTDNDFDVGDAYRVTQTGTAVASTGAAVLFGGTAGIGWIEQMLTTVAGQRYRVEFDVSGNLVAAQVGSASQASDVLAEASYPVGGERVLFFTATSVTSALQFRTNQNVQTSVDNISSRAYGIDGWRADDIGKWVYVHGGLVKLTAVGSAQQATGQILVALNTDDEAAGGAWTLESEAWSVANGYPAISQFYQQRLLYASSPQFPQTVWGSREDDFDNFARGNVASDAFSYTLAEAQGLLYWMLPAQQLVIGAENAPFHMTGENDTGISATVPPMVLTLGEYGTSQIEALKIGHCLIYVQRQGSKLRELTFQQVLYTYQAPEDLSLLSSHLLETDSIVQMAYAQEPVPVLALVRSDGVLLLLTYDKLNQIKAWARRVMGGGGLVKSIAVIPHPTRNANQPWLVVERTWNGVTTQAIEVVDDTVIGVDAAAVYAGVATTTLTGLGHLEGQSVRSAGIPATGSMWATFPAQTVTGGQITLPVACTQAYAGLPYGSILETLDPEVQGIPSIQTKNKRWGPLALALHETGEGVQMGLRGQRLQRVPLTRGQPTLDDGPSLFTGDVIVPNLGWDRSGRIRLVHDEPLPCTVLFIGGDLEVGD